MVYFVIVLLLSLSAGIIFTCINISLKLKSKYPDISCPSIAIDYNVNPKTQVISAADLGRWTDDALKEYRVNKAFEMQNDATHF